MGYLATVQLMIIHSLPKLILCFSRLIGKSPIFSSAVPLVGLLACSCALQRDIAVAYVPPTVAMNLARFQIPFAMLLPEAHVLLPGLLLCWVSSDVSMLG